MAKKKKKATKRKAAKKKAGKRKTTKRKTTKRKTTRKKAGKKKTTKKRVSKRKVSKKKSKKKKTTKRKTVKKKAKKRKTKRKPNPAFVKPLQPSSALAEVVGSAPIPRTLVLKKVWAYIKKNKLQDAKDRRNINPDAKLQGVLGKKSVSMFEMTKILNKHLS